MVNDQYILNIIITVHHRQRGRMFVLSYDIYLILCCAILDFRAEVRS